MLSQPEKSLRLKVWGITLIALIITSSAVAWSYKSFKELRTSIDQLSQPNHKLTLINDILQEFISAESNVQSYIVTGSLQSARTYEEQVSQTRLRIKELKELVKEDTAQLLRIDSLEIVFQKKLDDLNRFLVLKKKRQATVFTQLALAQIEANTEDTATTEKEIYYRSTAKDLGSIFKREGISQNDTSIGLWITLKRMLGTSTIRFDTITRLEQDYFTRKYTTSIDTTVIKSYNPDTVLQKVKQILSQTEDMELKMQQRLTQRELILLRQGQIFMDKIRSIITELEENERIRNEVQRQEASVIATNATLTIVLIGFGGFLIGGILFFLITRDITRVSYFRDQLEKAKSKAEKLSRIKENFLANMSHEIRTPLNSILGFTKLLKSTPLSTEQQRYMKAVNSSSAYLTELVNDILDHSKIESGNLIITHEAFSIQHLIKDVESMFRLSANRRKIDFNIYSSPDLPDWLKGDAFRIKQVITNLLSNALKFTDSGSINIHFGGGWFKDIFYFELKVKDTGIGIDEEKKKLIFESFRQAETSTVNNFGGTGLGLTITKQLVEAMNGKVSVISQKGVGSTFTVKLPLEKGELSTQQASKGSVDYFYDANILIIEDDHWNALLLETILRKSAKHVKTFNDPEKAIDHLKSNSEHIDLLFTDLKMPKISGELLIETCRAFGFNKPIIAVTAHLNPDSNDFITTHGIQALCTKPFQEEKIRELLKAFLPKKHQLKTHNQSQSKDHGDFEVDISDILKFAGYDKSISEELFDEMLINNYKQVEQFDNFLNTENWSELGLLSHKMLPTYDHTHVHEISEILASIVLHAELSNDQMVRELSTEVLPKLKDCLNTYESFKTQFHTA